jgi:hypothetical protein
MTRFLSSLPLVLILAGCAVSSGVPADRIAEADIAAAYLPLHSGGSFSFKQLEGAATLVAPGIAATNAHNADMVDPASVIGATHNYDLLFFRVPGGTPPPMAEPVKGMAVIAYGQGKNRDLRRAHGTVRRIVSCPGCEAPAYFVFEGNAGPGFSGGPVVDSQGRLVGITFGYKDAQTRGGPRAIFAYDMARVQAELHQVQSAGPGG